MSLKVCLNTSTIVNLSTCFKHVSYSAEFTVEFRQRMDAFISKKEISP